MIYVGNSYRVVYRGNPPSTSAALEITDTAKTGFFVCGTSGTGRAVASAQLVTGNYGA